MCKLARLLVLFLFIPMSTPTTASWGCSASTLDVIQGLGLCFMGVRWGMHQADVVSILERNNETFSRPSGEQMGIIPSDRKAKSVFLRQMFMVPGVVKNNGDIVDLLLSGKYGEKYAIAFHFKNDQLYSIFIASYHDSSKVNTLSYADSMNSALADFAIGISKILNPKSYIGDMRIQDRKIMRDARVYRNNDTISLSSTGTALWQCDYNMNGKEITYGFDRIKSKYGNKPPTDKQANNMPPTKEQNPDLRLEERKRTVESILN